MSKVIPAQLLAHKALPVTTLCRLMKVRCKDGTVFGFANHPIDVSFDDSSGDGVIIYRSAMGFTPMRLAAAAGPSVDNTDLRGVVADLTTLGIIEEEVRSGKLDYADAWIYEVNYNDLTAGRREIKGRGKCGNVSMAGEEFSAEFRSLTQHYKQAIGQVTSLTCRARFGSKPIGTGGEQPEERYPCGKDWVWTPFTVTDVSGTEPDRIFEASGLSGGDEFYTPGVFRMTTGANTGYESEVEEYSEASNGATVSATMPAYYPFQIGDEGEIRQDCTKVDDDAEHGCLYHYGADWVLHFRGEPLIPVGKEGELSTPGAEL